jgi:hypothetical protein
MPFTCEVCGTLLVPDSFRYSHARQLAQSIAGPADIYFATDAVTGAGPPDKIRRPSPKRLVSSAMYYPCTYFTYCI